MRKDLRELVAKLPGWEASLTKGRHVRLVHKETGAVVHHGSTPSDTRSTKNALATCKRELRRRLDAR